MAEGLAERYDGRIAGVHRSDSRLQPSLSRVTPSAVSELCSVLPPLSRPEGLPELIGRPIS
jgi:hypothetical protein